MANPILTHHPLSAAFPAMAEDDFRELVADIKAHGQRDPITVDDGAVIDGWHRYQACCELSIPAKIVPLEGDPVAFVQSKNLHRRHMTPSQRAMSVVACNAWRDGGRPSAANVAPGATLQATNETMAAEANVSPRTIRRAKAVTERGSDQLKRAVIDGRVTLKEAEQTLQAPATKPAEQEPTVATPRPQETSGPAVVVFRAATSAPQDDPPPEQDDTPSDGESHTPTMGELLDEAQAEIEALTARVKVAEADDLAAEALKWRAAYDQAVKGQSEAMERAKQAVERETWVMRQLRRCGKAVGEGDPTKIAARVEALARERTAA